LGDEGKCNIFIILSRFKFLPDTSDKIDISVWCVI
jgi:hypothetical protein